MSTRHHGQPVVVYPMHTVTDNRGQKSRVVDLDNPVSVKARWVSTSGGTVTMGIDPLPDGLELGARIEWDGGTYNAGTPSHYNGRVRHTRHWAVELKRTS